MKKKKQLEVTKNRLGKVSTDGNKNKIIHDTRWKQQHKLQIQIDKSNERGCHKGQKHTWQRSGN